MSEKLLELQNLCYSYEDSPFSIQNLSLCICKGERIAVLGGNGAGKSTFFLLCNGAYRASRGKLLYRGREISQKKDLLYLRQKVGIVFQDPNQQLIGSTVEGEISFGPMNLRLTNEQVAQRVDAAVRSMQLEEYRRRPPHFLSGGEKKRVSIADVLAMEPEVILFDEPTASLDPSGVRMLENILDTLKEQGKTLVVSTHDIDFAWRWATRVVVLHEGSLIADALPEQVFADALLLQRAGLDKPHLYAVAELLRQRGLLYGATPRSIEELSYQLDIANTGRKST